MQASHLAVGLVMHLDGASVKVNSKQRVGQWTDISGNGNTLLKTSKKPKQVIKTNILGGKPFVKFDGKNDALGAPTTSSLPIGNSPRSGTPWTPLSQRLTMTLAVFMVVDYRSSGYGGFSWGDDADFSCGRQFGLGVTSMKPVSRMQLTVNRWWPYAC